VNKNMSKKNVKKQMLVIVIMVFLAVVSLSGCVNNQNTGSDLGKFIGTWTGNKEISMFGGGSNASITQLTFTENIVEATLNSEQGTYTMNYTYNAQGDKLVLEPKFTGVGGFPGRQSYNRTRPYNGTRPNGTRNGTRPPYNDGSGQPFGGQPPSMSISFDYSFNEGYTVLYLDGSQFTKIQ
jgi:hypothetical protein